MKTKKTFIYGIGALLIVIIIYIGLCFVKIGLPPTAEEHDACTNYYKKMSSDLDLKNIFYRQGVDLENAGFGPDGGGICSITFYTNIPCNIPGEIEDYVINHSESLNRPIRLSIQKQATETSSAIIYHEKLFFRWKMFVLL